MSDTCACVILWDFFFLFNEINERASLNGCFHSKLELFDSEIIEITAKKKNATCVNMLKWRLVARHTLQVCPS